MVVNCEAMPTLYSLSHRAVVTIIEGKKVKVGTITCKSSAPHENVFIDVSFVCGKLRIPYFDKSVSTAQENIWNLTKQRASCGIAPSLTVHQGAQLLQVRVP